MIWSINYNGYSKEDERTREVLLAVGNGYLGVRGAAEETRANAVNYPATYIAGLYNRLESKIAGRTVENDDMVNVPNWTCINFKIEGGDWCGINTIDILDHNRRLDFKTGVFRREMRVKDSAGRITAVISSRIASMADPHVVAIRYEVVPENYSGKVSIKSGLDGNVENAGVERYRQLNCLHLEPVAEGGDSQIRHLTVRTTQSGVEISEVEKLIVRKNGQTISPEFDVKTKKGEVHSIFEVELREKEKIEIDKIVSIYTSRDVSTENPLKSADRSIEAVKDFDDVLQKSSKKWKDIWDEIDIKIEDDPDAQKLVRLHLYHLMVTASPNNRDIDAGIPARGLHGEAYRGHIFWDELFILPFYNIHFPEISRSALLYRYRRLGKAREYAKQHGYKGAMFPWQSAGDGREETPTVHLNPVSGKWGEDYSSYQRHVSLAVAYNVWDYYNTSKDVDFIEEYGAEMIFEICRFIASMATLNSSTGRYEIKNVMGPDEFHEKYKGSDEKGLKDNAYTNIMSVWLFCRAIEVLKLLNNDAKEKVLKKISLTENEINLWHDISNKLNISISDDGVIEQFDGFFGLKDLDLNAYKNKYGNIHRMDRILKAEGLSPDDFKVIKQADLLMAFYILGTDEVASILKRLGYNPVKDLLKKNYDYYFPITSHGSTLSKVVHSHLAALLGNRETRLALYKDALASDYTDVQGGTTGEGIHVGVMAGTVIILKRLLSK